MMGALKRAYESFRGGGDYSITVPPMDGALRPNNAIEEAELVASAPAADNVVADANRVVFSSGHDLLAFEAGRKPRCLASYDSRISALALFEDALAVGLSTGRIVIVGGHSDGKAFGPSPVLPFNCPTALAFAGSDTLLVANGSSANGPDDWKTDLMDRNAKGSVWSLNLASRTATRIADGLAYPNGLLPLGGEVLVSEAWRYRLIRVAPGKPVEIILPDLPAYPARLSPTASGEGAWLALFAPRRRLVELVLREKAYRRRMMLEIPPDYWISPSIRPMSSFLEPLQGGTLKKLARLKPWAPSRSCGLIVRLDREFQVTASFHSRADGARHGISSCAVSGSRLLAASAGGDVLVSLDPKGL
jgi:hypothetical protein